MEIANTGDLKAIYVRQAVPQKPDVMFLHLHLTCENLISGEQFFYLVINGDFGCPDSSYLRDVQLCNSFIC
jgi:hypothetical protein